MAFTLHEVHKFERIQGTTETRLVRVNDYIRLYDQEWGYPLYIQNGAVWTEDGEQVIEPPDSFYEQVSKCNPKALEAVGWNGEAASAEIPAKRPTR